VQPPAVDRFGFGTRVPALIVSPYARRGYIGRQVYDHASVLKLIEWRFGLAPLTERDRRAAAPLEAFDFTQPPRSPIALP
jgi:phospholipase C